uniref:Uncharacterized protein n=1 Tax=Lotus japonicus TaxID=34305 RepID=I3SY83_LOTJA|nr:unknown [Lotus japonicus]
MQTKPIQRRIESKGFGVISEISDFDVSVVVKLEVHRVHGSATFFPQLFFHGFHCQLKREADVRVESFEI